VSKNHLTQSKSSENNGNPEAVPVDEATVPRIRALKHNDKTVLLPDCPDLRRGIRQLGQAIPGADLAFVNDLMWQIANSARRGGEIDERILSFAVALVIESKPRDRLEPMHIAQMAAAHLLTLEFAKRLANAEFVHEVDLFERTFNKLARTFATLMDVRKRYRADDEHNFAVQNVSITDGGQAIVGNVTQNASVDAMAKRKTSLAEITNAPATPMPITDENKVLPERTEGKQK
jgi:hypothetical protein